MLTRQTESPNDWTTENSMPLLFFLINKTDRYLYRKHNHLFHYRRYKTSNKVHIVAEPLPRNVSPRTNMKL